MARRILCRVALTLVVGFFAAACGDSSDSGSQSDPIIFGAIPDQDPDILARNYGLLADYLAAELGRPVEFRPVTEYDSAVTAFRVGDFDFVWFGGLTGVQARLQVDGAVAFAQRDIDREFTSVFIATTDSGIGPLNRVDDLAAIAGRRLTFGSDSSTSGRLMPQWFLDQAGVTLDDLDGEPGFSGAHDATIALVDSGTYEVGALNSQVWRSRVESGDVDLSKVELIFETPTYFDYHWVARPEFDESVRNDVLAALNQLDPNDAAQAEILAFFGAAAFVETTNTNYDNIEKVGREIGKIEN